MEGGEQTGRTPYLRRGRPRVWHAGAPPADRWLDRAGRRLVAISESNVMSQASRPACSKRAISSLSICSMASITRFDLAGLGSLISFDRTLGTICQVTPYLSVSQPQRSLWPPLESFSQR